MVKKPTNPDKKRGNTIAKKVPTHLKLDRYDWKLSRLAMIMGIRKTMNDMLNS